MLLFQSYDSIKNVRRKLLKTQTGACVVSPTAHNKRKGRVSLLYFIYVFDIILDFELLGHFSPIRYLIVQNLNIMVWYILRTSKRLGVLIWQWQWQCQHQNCLIYVVWVSNKIQLLLNCYSNRRFLYLCKWSQVPAIHSFYTPESKGVIIYVEVPL